MSSCLLPENFATTGPYPRLNRRLRLGVVGGGRIASTQSAAARMTECWDIVAGALSSDPDKAQKRGSNWYIEPNRCYASFEEMAREEAKRTDGIDAVMVTTPNHLHFPAAKAFIDEGIAVLCDKPLTNEVEEAQALVKQVNKRGAVFAVGYAMSCIPMVRQARELVAAGEIGKVNQIHTEFMQDWMMAEGVLDADHVKWRLDPKQSGPTSCTGDIGTHAAHLGSFVSGVPLTHVRADMHVLGAPKALEDTVFISTRHANEIPGTLLATRYASGNRGGLRFRIFGSQGGLEWDLENADYLKLSKFGQPDQIITRGHGHGVSPTVERLVRAGRGFPEGIMEAWANLYLEFAMAIAAARDGITVDQNWGRHPEVTDGLEGVKFINAAVKSHQQDGSWQKV